ncbi:MAG: hypothetical protein M3O74_13895 [Pseudomonadota bacterium]|nr:hypothetical protein [Pseudomonadota bacterium]
MNNKLRRAIAITLVVASAAANAKEIMFRCDVTSKATYNIPALNHDADDPVTRHYVFDDSKNLLWIILEGERRPACPAENCTQRVSKTMIATVQKFESFTSRMTIDRLAGRLTDNVETLSGNVHGYNLITGPCRPETLDELKF